jgi:hypothetical protein
MMLDFNRLCDPNKSRNLSTREGRQKLNSFQNAIRKTPIINLLNFLAFFKNEKFPTKSSKSVKKERRKKILENRPYRTQIFFRIRTIDFI